MFEGCSDASLVTAIGDSARTENAACARRLAAIAELHARRQVAVEDGRGRELWRIDRWDAVAAEVAAAQGITAARADELLHNALCLHERLPKVAAVFATGVIDYRTVRMIVARTLLAIEPEVMAAIDAEIADTIRTWGALSVRKTERAIDRIVERHDPDARRRTESQARSRHVDITQGRNTAYLSGQLHQTDATLLDRRLTALAQTVCAQDPRTPDQRRADALGALAAGATALACACGSSDCPAAENDSVFPVVVHVVAEAAALDGADTADMHGEHPDDTACERVTDPARLIEIIRETVRAKPDAQPRTGEPVPRAGVLLGGSTVPAGVLADLVARGVAELRPVVHPGESPPEPRYRPSAKLAEFVRCRDLTCRFPGCDRPADVCDVDHTVPYDRGGPTHASNLKCLCRKHHLLKTFWCGPDGWHDEQWPDGTVVWTSPSGHIYSTAPGSKLLVPALCVPTGSLKIRRREDVSTHRGAMMPTRRRTRAADRHYRVMAERTRYADAHVSGVGGRGTAG
jgi:hypothetical protein